MTLAQATQPCQNLWTPGEVAMLMGVFASVVVAAVVTGIVKVIEAGKNARIAVIQATAAHTKADTNASQLIGLQQQVTQVALSAQPPAAAAVARPSPVAPVTFADAQIQDRTPGREG